MPSPDYFTPINVRIPAALRDRIDAHRPATLSREAWVREACHEKLEREQQPFVGVAAPDPSRPVGQLANATTGQATPVRRPARDVATPEPIATVPANTERRLTKQELDMQRQQKLNSKKGATKR